MDSFVTDISDDNHICIRCKQTINGLDNYVEHRKSGLCSHTTADQFFNCLQLQYKYKSVYDSNEDEDERSVRSGISGDNQSDNNSDEDQSEEEVDIYRPPNNFTGGKWKPGSGPQSSTQSNSGITSYVSDESSNESEVLISEKLKEWDQTIKSTEEKDSIKSQTQLNLDSKTNCHSIDWNNCHEIRETVLDSNNCLTEEEVITNTENEFKCKLCSFKAIHSFDLLKHYLNSTNHSNSDVLSLDMITENESNLMKNLSFICQICSFYTNQSNNFFWHLTTSEHSLKISSRTTHYLCKPCGQTCDDVQNLMVHLESNQLNHSNSSGPLIVCKINKISQNINNSKNCLNHLFDRFNCDFCGKVFKFKTHLKKHTISEHIQRVAFPDLIKSNFIGDNPKYSCLKCDFKTDRESTHLLHSLNHQMPVQSAQGECDQRKGSNRKQVKRNADKYKCPLCDNTYICRQLQQHINIHLNVKPFECIQCDKSFSKLIYLKNHEKSHSGIKDKVCHTCGHCFASNKLLKNHMKIHDVNRERTVSCELCGAQFYSKYILSDHMKRHLPKTYRQFKCQFSGCSFAFIKKSELTEHSRVHSAPDDKPFLCDRCPYKTKSIYTFRKHYRQHTGDYPFKCQFCDFKTNLSSNFIRHSRIHTGVKPYGCPYCSYVCNTQENVRKHILKTNKHKDLYVYPCSHCEYKTNLFSDYRKHLEERHSDLYTNEEIDGLVSHLFRNNTNNV